MTRFGRNMPSSVKVSIPTDENGMTGRECPDKQCLGYFKVRFGTGLTGEDLPCHCPYCGHTGPHDTFFTPEQLEYAKSIAIREFSKSIVKELKKMEFTSRSRGPLGIGFSMKVKPGSPLPIRYYREKLLETDVECSQCTLQYSIYGVFGHCPDCGIHNSLQILLKNLEIACKELDLAAQQEELEMRDHLVGDALENVVSAFDGFGRETVSLAPANDALSFQNLITADSKVATHFGTTLSSGVTPDQWQLTVRCFQKRHLLAHKMGVIDDKYLATANDVTARIGRKVQITAQEVRDLIAAVSLLGNHLMKLVHSRLPQPSNSSPN